MELCCAGDSKISSTVPQACLANRVTEKDYLTSKSTITAVHKLIKMARHYEVEVFMGKRNVHSWIPIEVTK